MTNYHATVVIPFCKKQEEKKRVITAYGIKAVNSKGH
jgi:hypothetical protein